MSQPGQCPEQEPAGGQAVAAKRDRADLPWKVSPDGRSPVPGQTVRTAGTSAANSKPATDGLIQPHASLAS